MNQLPDNCVCWLNCEYTLQFISHSNLIDQESPTVYDVCRILLTSWFTVIADDKLTTGGTQLVMVDSEDDCLHCLHSVDSAFKVHRLNTVFYFAAERQNDMAKYVDMCVPNMCVN